jgi:hypothetical protein
MAYQKFTIPRLLGLNQDENPDALATGELTRATNAARRGSFVGTRPGVAALATGEDYENAIDEAGAIRGAHEFRESFDEGRHLLVVADHTTGTKLFFEDGSQLPSGASDPSINPDEDYIYSMAVHANVLYGTGGPPGKSQVQTEDMWTWDGDTTNEANALTLTDKQTGAQLYPKFIIAWRNFLAINGLQQTTANRTASNNPSVTRYPTFGTDPSDDTNWTDGHTIGFNATRIGLDTYGENFATGFGTYTDDRGDFLMLLSNKQIAAVRGDTQFGNDFIVTDTIANGCVHQRAFVNLGLDVGDAIFVSDKPAVHSLRQSQSHGDTEGAFLSWKIRTFMNGLNKTRIHHTCAAYAANLGMVVFAFSTASNTSEGHDVLMCLDVRDPGSLTAGTARWYGPWRLGGGIRVNHLAYLRSASNVPSLHLFTTAGRVLRLDEDVHSDLATNGYSVLIETKPESFGDTLSEKRIGDTSVVIASDVGGSYGVTARTLFDFGRIQSGPVNLDAPASTGSVIGSGAIIGTATIGESFSIAARKLYTSGRGQLMQFQFQHGGTNEPFYIGRIDTQVAGAGEASESSD